MWEPSGVKSSSDRLLLWLLLRRPLAWRTRKWNEKLRPRVGEQSWNMTKCQAEELSHGDNGLRSTSVFSPPVEAFYFRGFPPCRVFLFPLPARAQSIFCLIIAAADSLSKSHYFWFNFLTWSETMVVLAREKGKIDDNIKNNEERWEDSSNVGREASLRLNNINFRYHYHAIRQFYFRHSQ